MSWGEVIVENVGGASGLQWGSYYGECCWVKWTTWGQKYYFLALGRSSSKFHSVCLSQGKWEIYWLVSFYNLFIPSHITLQNFNYLLRSFFVKNALDMLITFKSLLKPQCNVHGKGLNLKRQSKRPCVGLIGT